MGWIGKILGALLGYRMFRSVWGAVVGALIGHLADQYFANKSSGADSSLPESVANLYFRTTFELMGHIAKSDGRVSPSEIDAASRIMADLGLDPEDKSRAQKFFGLGKAAGYDVESAVKRLGEVCAERHELLRTFVDLQLRAALDGNGISPPARAILTRLADRLGISGMEFAQMEALQRLRRQFASGGLGGGQWDPGAAPGGSRSQSGGYGSDGSHSRGGGGRSRSLAAYYAELEVEASASDSEVTKAYRRQMSRHHPDKLVANGLPESMARIAKEKTQRIQQAYEEIRAARGMR